MRSAVRILLIAALVFTVLCSGFATAENSPVPLGFDPPLPLLSIYAESIPSNLMYFVLNTPDLSVQVEYPDGPFSSEEIISKLQSPDYLTDIILVETNMTGYLDLINSGVFENLSGVSYLRERIIQMPPAISALCYSGDALYAIPVGICVTADSDIHSYADLVKFTALPDNVTITVALLNSNSINTNYSVILLDCIQRFFPTYIQSLLFPTH